MKSHAQTASNKATSSTPSRPTPFFQPASAHGSASLATASLATPFFAPTSGLVIQRQEADGQSKPAAEKKKKDPVKMTT